MSAASNAAPDCAGRDGAPSKLYWEYTPGGMGGAHVVLMADDGKYVGHFYDDVSEGVDIDAVLALIAAAPELLEALRAVKKIVDDAAKRPTGFLVADFQTATYPNSRDAYDGLCAAIAKAEGRS